MLELDEYVQRAAIPASHGDVRGSFADRVVDARANAIAQRDHVGTGDDRVWSETGCTCLLVTSTKDVLR